MSETNPNTITIDSIAYDRAGLSEEALNQIGNLQATERKISETEQHLAMLKAACMAYANALKTALPANG